VLLRLEGAVLLGTSAFFYSMTDESWLLFALLLLAPDAGVAGYAAGSRVGAVIYDAFHTYLPPAVLIVAGVLAGSDLIVGLGLIWVAHIGMDRMLGFGLKYPSGFRDTHLGTIGRR
jgi:hypothetical protein